ncbi:MerR family transcriptional regulator [Caenimonas aquaedulcis]|uniref:Cobalamin-dependent protein n=1 Tax=Caenimonas aquaedulcis TaxID=2793270 RepID=A0A931MI87_9BURK|nr:MerR family transcriptional regulator [Caenimonas aquaedulcis]MBG9389584.1 cobalamin-dependent protein [Caenimonas aquaedulcis]
MNPPAAAPAPPLRSIAEVERETQLPRATLRIWERRYGFPAPSRDDRGERTYPADQVEQLRLMRSLVDQGHRPARLLAAGPAEIRMLAQAAKPSQAPRSAAHAHLLRMLREHDAGAVRAELESRIGAIGLAHFVGVEMPQMNVQVGQAWSDGELEVHEEHLYSDCVYQVVRGAIAQLQKKVRPEAPQVLLTTFPQEHHGLGILMAHAMFALQRCPTVSLGVRLPVAQIVAGARAYRADLVGLSFTPTVNPSHVLRGLEELRGALPPAVRIWAGGNNPALSRREIAGVRFVRDVLAIPHLLAEDFTLPPMD